MTEVSKEAVEALEEILMSSFPEVSFVGLDMSVDFINRLSKSGFTIAPIATPASDAPWTAESSDERIKRLMKSVGMPDSQSLYQAFKQCENELCQQYAAARTSAADEKLLEAVAILWRPGVENELRAIESALSELAQRRAEEINLKADNARIRELAECYNNEIEQWQKRYMALAESTLKVNAIPSIMMPLPTPPKED